MELPVKATRATKMLGFDADGDPIMSTSTMAEIESAVLVTKTVTTGGAVTDAANVIYDQGGTGSVSRTVENKLQESVSVKDFGAVGDGVTDDTAAIQAAYTAAAGRELYFPYTSAGYKISASLTIPANTSTEFEKGAFIDATGSITWNETGLFYTEGAGLGADVGGGVTGALTEGDLTLTFVSAPSVAIGDLITVRNTIDYSWNAERNYYRQGEFCEVIAISGNVVTLSGPLLDSYPSTATVNVMGTTTCSFKNMKVIMDNTQITTYSVIRIHYGRNCAVDDCEFVEMASRGVILRESFNCVIRHLSATKYEADLSAAVQSNGAILTSCQRCHITDSVLRGNMHATSISGGGYIVSRYCTVTHSSLSSVQSWAMDLGHCHHSHCSVRFCSIVNGAAIGSEHTETTDNEFYEGPSTTTGIIIFSGTRSANHLIARNKFYVYNDRVMQAGNASFSAFTANTVFDGTLRFIDNEIYDNIAATFTHMEITNHGCTADISLEITGNKQVSIPSGTYDKRLMIVGVTTGSAFKDFNISNNTTIDCGLGTISNWTNLLCDGNIINQPTNGVAGFTITGETGDAIVRNNIVRGYGAGSSVVGTSGSALNSLTLENNQIIDGIWATTFTVAHINTITCSNNVYGNLDDATLVSPFVANSSGASYDINIKGDIYNGGSPTFGVNAHGISEFTMNKKLDLTTPATSFPIFAVPSGMWYMPTSCVARADTILTATTGNFLGVGVVAANRRVDYGVSVAASSSAYAKNTFIQYIQQPAQTSQATFGGESVSLISATTAADSAALGSNVGGASQSVTVQIQGTLIGKLKSL
jgi:hypothetical protein